MFHKFRLITRGYIPSKWDKNNSYDKPASIPSPKVPERGSTRWEVSFFGVPHELVIFD